MSTLGPLFGIFGSCIGIVGCFKGASGDIWSLYLRMMSDFSEALFPTCLALLVAIPAFAAWHIFRARVDRMDDEARLAILELESQLARM
ncbi:MAG: MotA/TolQ/ExbB proton channel family protein [Bryobacteraceae bacterium]|nr:MotA/TolQ/ExbB proton channel family protein [Bryobacteraceae bacterium]